MSTTVSYFVNVHWADDESFIFNVGTPSLRKAFDLLRENVTYAVERGGAADVRATIYTLSGTAFAQGVIDGWVAQMVADPTFEVEGSGRDRKATGALLHA